MEAAAKRIVSYITEVLGIAEDLTPYTEIIGTSIEKEGITVHLKEAIVTPNAILVAVDVKGAPEGYGVGDGDIIINFKKFKYWNDYDSYYRYM